MKRSFDFLLALLLLIATTPVFVFISMLVFVNLGRPVFFSQIRPGLHHRPFTIYKFRTMMNPKDWESRSLNDDARLTKFGRLLRHTSLDELPELWNVVKGEMSLVGPRPLLMEYLPLYTPEQARRHDVKPGITGWAQVNGRNTISWDEKFKLDVWYVDHFSIWLYMKILGITMWKVFKREGITQEGHATAEKFHGSVG